jgi:hypothetical protein
VTDGVVAPVAAFVGFVSMHDKVASAHSKITRQYTKLSAMSRPGYATAPTLISKKLSILGGLNLP